MVGAPAVRLVGAVVVMAGVEGDVLGVCSSEQPAIMEKPANRMRIIQTEMIQPLACFMAKASFSLFFHIIA
jgi:hypothetical protein